MTKKGLSPLIATVLLIAFAVALGVMIMTWTQNIPTGATDCSNIVLETVNICYTKDTLDLTIKNSGTVDAGGLVLGINDEGQTIPALNIKNSGVSAGSRLQKIMPYLHNGNLQLTITPQIQEGDNLITCKSPQIDMGTVLPCT